MKEACPPRQDRELSRGMGLLSLPKGFRPSVPKPVMTCGKSTQIPSSGRRKEFYRVALLTWPVGVSLSLEQGEEGDMGEQGLCLGSL